MSKKKILDEAEKKADLHTREKISGDKDLHPLGHITTGLFSKDQEKEMTQAVRSSVALKDVVRRIEEVIVMKNTSPGHPKCGDW